MPTFSRDGLSLHYEAHGSGRPAILLHGAAASFAGNYLACGWVDRLTARATRPIGLDFLGHGRSDKPYDPGRYGIDALAGDVVALLDHLALERASIVGFSIGSAVALHALHTFPGRFDRAALVAAGDGLVGHPPLTFPALLPGLAELAGRTEFPADLPPQAGMYWTLATQVAGDREAVAAFARAEYPPCSPAEAAAIDVPVLVVGGERDQVLGTGARLAAAIRTGTYLEVAGADHFSLAVDETAQAAVADFLALA